MVAAKIELPQAIAEIFTAPRGSYQYRVAKGGRGSGKSVGAAIMALLWGYADPIRILCVRQYQNSIQKSFYSELVDAMKIHPWLAEQYTVTRDSITGKNGTQFVFKGLEINPQSIKSLAKIDLTIVEEAEDIPELSWLYLEATVLRQRGSEIWVIYNPRKEGSPVDKRFVIHKPGNAIVRHVNWQDNPFFPDGLNMLRQRDLEVFDYAMYSWIWEGAYLKNSKSQIFHDKFSVKTFVPEKGWSGPYQGLDWGYSQDPTVMIRSWVNDKYLYISHEAGGVGIELDDISGIAPCDDWDKFVTRADSAQPAMISHVRRRGMPKIEGAKKGKGSIVDGIQFIRSFNHIYVHPRCRNTLDELSTYSWKVDRLSGDILDVPDDANNHYVDALRYSLEPIMKRSKVSYAWV